MLKGRDNPATRIDGQMIATAARLNVALHHLHRFRVRNLRRPDQAVIFANESGERERLRRAEREIPGRNVPGFLPFAR